MAREQDDNSGDEDTSGGRAADRERLRGRDAQQQQERADGNPVTADRVPARAEAGADADRRHDRARDEERDLDANLPAAAELAGAVEPVGEQHAVRIGRRSVLSGGALWRRVDRLRLALEAR